MTAMTSSEDGSHSAAEGPLATRLAIFAFLAALLLQLALASRPFHHDWEGIMAWQFQSQFARVWDDAGFLALGGRPEIHPLPTRPTSGELYVNHPVLAHWLIYASVRVFGNAEFGLRLMPTLATSLVVALLVGLTTRRGGRWSGLALLALALSSPAVIFFGRMANYEPLLVGAGLPATLLFFRRRDRRDLLWGALLAFVAASIDWEACFMLAAMVAIDLLARRPAASLRAALPFGAAVVAALVVFLALVSAWTGGLQAALDQLRAAFALGRAGGDRPEAWSFLLRQVEHLRRLYATPAVCALALVLPVGLVRLLRRRDDLVARLVWTWFLVGLARVLAFPYRAMDHDFWMIHALPAVLLAAWFAVATAARRSRWLAAGLLVLLVAGNLHQVERRAADRDFRDDAAVIAFVREHFDADTLVVCSTDDAGPWVMTVPCWLHFSVDPLEVRSLRERYFAGDFRTRRFALWYPAWYDRVHAGLLADERRLARRHESDGTWSVLFYERP